MDEKLGAGSLTIEFSTPERGRTSSLQLSFIYLNTPCTES